tara:strand:+ start:195 stop:875 length:681 start_codon:yes stop_codon:yes gene_type:complete
MKNIRQINPDFQQNMITSNHLRKFDKIIKCWNLSKPIQVQVRKVGKTSQGIKNRCHNNVCEIVQYLGGKQVTGFAFTRKDNAEFTQMVGHSVWLTPEGKYVDVTLGKQSRLDHITFIPVKTFDPLTEYYQCTVDVIVFDNVHEGCAIKMGFDDNYEKLPMNYWTRIKKQKDSQFHCVDMQRVKNVESQTQDTWQKEYNQEFNENVFNFNRSKMNDNLSLSCKEVRS